jgi:hypothetical protein
MIQRNRNSDTVACDPMSCLVYIIQTYKGNAVFRAYALRDIRIRAERDLWHRIHFRIPQREFQDRGTVLSEMLLKLISIPN